MNLETLFRQAVQVGIDYDPRGRKSIEKMLKKQKEQMAKLKGKELEFFDEERTWNPFPDCRVLYTNGKENVKRLMVGIDIESTEMLLADRLREKGEKIDAILIHHPEGRALADLDKVMPLQIDLLALHGVPVNHTEAQLRPRQDRIWRSIHADNLFRSQRVAELFDLPSMVCHTITDNIVWDYMEENICKKKEYDTLDEIVNAINDIPEYNYFAKKGNPVFVVNGSGRNRPGKVVATEFTGGTNGPEEFLAEQSAAGIGTILTMHATEKSLEEARKHHVNMIQCSHMPSDALGVNLLLDILSQKTPLETLDVSGFIRVKRSAKKR